MAALVTIPGVELCRVGHWEASTGPWDCTAEQIAAAVDAQHDPTFGGPAVLKLGHFGFGAGESDADPGIGRIKNLRASDDGQILLGDLVGVPAPLAEIMTSAYPARSVEAALEVTTKSGRYYAMVLTGLALLGETPPAIASLADVYELYGTTDQVADYIAAATVAATTNTRGEPMPPTEAPKPTLLESPEQRQKRLQASRVKAGASITDLYDAFREWRATDEAKNAGISAAWSWILDVYTDTVIVESEGADEYTLYRVTWAEAGGKFTFGGAEKVVQSYEPAPEGSLLAASGRVPLHVVAAALEGKSGTTDPFSRPEGRTADDERPALLRSGRGRGSDEDSQEQHMPDLASLRKELGLSDDTSDDDVINAAAQRLSQQPTTEPAAPASTPPASVAPPAQPVAPPAPEHATDVAAALRPYTDQLSVVSAELAAMKEEKRIAARQSLIGDAVKAGKITPAQREMWESQFDQAPDVATQILASLAPGSAVPVSAAGRTGAADTGDADDSEYADLKALLGWAD